MNHSARHSDPSTSHTAARSASQFIHDHHAKILASLEVDGPGTIHDIAARTGINHVAVARRMKELETQFLAFRNGTTRPSPLGRQCKVWQYWSLV
jgi:predicted ArsR family transcriptional regulator